MQKVNIFWHRRDLRIEDNPSLFYALTSEFPVVPIFIFDEEILDDLSAKDDARVTFIHDELTHLNDLYSKHNSSLIVLKGKPLSAFNELFQKFEVVSVYANRDYEPYAKLRDDQVKTMLAERGVEFFTFKDHVIFEEGEIFNDQGEPYKVFTPYKNKWLEKFSQINIERFPSETKLEGLCSLNIEIPSLEDIGFSRSSISFPKTSIDPSTIEQYDAQRNFPAIDGTSKIGVHLRFGTLSIRSVVERARVLSDTWLSELIWREFYMMILAHYPHVVSSSFKPKYDGIKWINDKDQFEMWCQGKTGYPIVDAGMRELNATGYMHNRVRMVVASFLTKHLLIDWRWGEQYFAEKLLDFELSSNNGGWQWAAGTGTDAQPYFRVFNPTSQQEKFDPQLRYIRKWIPELDTPDYPKPMVDHKTVRLRAIETYKEAVL